ncbi:MAG: hypothetical protein KKB51_14470 [Candidatus Riflebacteria bacterium]|nr:hypothetical protein [Candidatus Riflebacteria bacterium]
MYRVFIVALLLFVASSAFALPYQVGDYRFDVTVRNSAMNLVPSFKVSFYRYDQSSYVAEARGIGYKSVRKRIDIKPNQFIYKTEVVLPDLDRQLYVIDHNDGVLSAAYIRTDQFGFPGDHYGLTAYIPIEMWEPGEQQVEVFDSFWGAPLKKSCAIEAIEGYYKVSLSITRKALKWSGSKIYVVFRTSAPANPRIARRHLKRLNQLSADASRPAGSEEALTAYIYNNFSEQTADFSDPLSAVYAKYQAARQRFSQLHRE